MDRSTLAISFLTALFSTQIVCAQAGSACADWSHVTHAPGTFTLSGDASGTKHTAPYTQLRYNVHQSVSASMVLTGNTGTGLIALPGAYKKTISISAQYTTTYNPPGGGGYTTTVSYEGSATQEGLNYTAELQFDLQSCHFSLIDDSYLLVTETQNDETSSYPFFWGPSVLPSGAPSTGPPQRAQPLFGANLHNQMSFAAPDSVSSDYAVDIQWNATLDLTGQGGDLGPQTAGSQIPAPHTSDSSFVAASSNKSCQYSNDGPIRLSIPITRVVGDVDNTGLLSNSSLLVSNGVVSPYVTLRLAAFDVDSDAAIEPELDYVTLNGFSLNQLKGKNGEWVVNEFQVPVDAIRFGKRNPGADPTPGENQIEISIDLVSQGLRPLHLWCMGLDWAQLEFKALSPVIMIHGNNSSHKFWEAFDFIAPFQENGIPFDHLVDLPTASIEDNAAALKTILSQKAHEFGAKWLHLVAHSKGGLDARQFLTSDIPADLGVRSLTTLSTPHHGSALADFAVYAPQASLLETDPSLPFLASKILGALFGVDPGKPDLTTASVKAFNLWNQPVLPPSFLIDDEVQPVAYYSFSADANLDGSTDASGRPTIQDFENKGTGFTPLWASQFAYLTLWDVAEASLAPKSNPFGTSLVLEQTPNLQPQLNDFLVTLTSARLSPLFTELYSSKDNHATLANRAIALRTIQAIKAIQPVK